MSFTASVLVVAHRTAQSVGLERALHARQERGPVAFTLLVPIGRAPNAERTVAELAARLRSGGLSVEGAVGDGDALNAVLEIWSPARFDEIIVSTLPASTSRWMQAGLVRRIERHTGALVRHVEARDVHVALLASTSV
jgi:hypothetical protein